MNPEKIKMEVARINRLIQRVAGVKEEDVQEDFYVAMGMIPYYDEDSHILSLGDEDEDEYYGQDEDGRVEKSGRLSKAESWEEAFELAEKVCLGKQNIAEIKNFIGGNADEEGEGKTISFTGTFSVPRKELEEILADAGHEIVTIGKKTEVFLVGEKTASPKKIAKAESMGIAILRETDPEKILAFLGGKNQNKPAYRDFYERDGEVFEATVSDVVDIYDDFVSWNRDNGEWVEEDCLRALQNPNEVKKDLAGPDLAIQVDEDKFFAVFCRIILIDYVNQKFCEDDGDIDISNIRSFISLSSEDFLRKLLKLEFLDFGGEDSAAEKLEYVREEFADDGWPDEVMELAKLL